MRVGIIGGGVGGLLTGVKAVDNVGKVDLYEEHTLVGYPRHCTGLVSDRVLNCLGSGVKNHVLNTFKSYTLIHSLRPNKRLELRFRNTIYLIDRPSVERYLSEEFQKRGGSLYLGLKIAWVDPNNTSLGIGNTSLRKYDIIVIAEGARAVLTRASGMCGDPNYLVGLQTIIKCKNDLENPYVIFGDDVSKEFFGWVIPVSERRLIFGLADSYVSYAKLNRLVKTYLMRKFGINNLVVEEVFGGLIPTSSPCRQTFKNVIGIGDAVSVVKPLSGGGIYGISRQVMVLEELLRRSDTPEEVLKGYEGRLSSLITVLKIQHVLRKCVVRRFNSLSNFVMKLIDLGINDIHILDYDIYMADLLDVKDLSKAFTAFLI